MYEDCVLDLETTDLGSNSNILSIGAVLMNKSGDKLGPTFYRVIDQTSNLGFTTSKTVLDWWSKQSEEARKVFTDPGTPLGLALDDFTIFLGMNSNNIKVWGNGSDFDNVILQNAYHAIGKDVPWKFRNNRCFRTYRNEVLVKPEETLFKGVRHNALDDAVHEAINLQILYQANNSVVQIAKHKILSLVKKGREWV